VKIAIKGNCFAVLVSLVAGCGGSEIGPTIVDIPDDAMAKYVGLVTAVTDFQSERETRITAEFIELETAWPVSQLISGASSDALYGVDECVVTVVGGNPFPERGGIFSELESETVSAGDFVLLSGGESEFVRLYPDFEYIYNHPLDLALDLPDNLRVSFPGAGYPGAPGVPFPEVKNVTNLQPLTLEAVGEEPFSWDAYNSPTSKIDFGILVNDVQVVYCSVVDDGHFVLPDEVISELGVNSEFNFVVVSRRSTKFNYHNNALTITNVAPTPITIGDGNYVQADQPR